MSQGGIILALQKRYGIGDLTRGLLGLINTKPTESMQGQVEFLNNWII